MSLRIDKPASPKSSTLLRHCYLFVNRDWQHLPREESPDQGFEVRFRDSCIAKLVGWVVSQHREMGLGLGITTASGVLHEIDIVTQSDPVFGVLELKNRAAWMPEKNDVIVFFAKMLDYLCLNASLLKANIVPIFLSSHGFEQSGLAACLGLGIHPVAPYLRPLPVLVDNARCMLAEKTNYGVTLSETDDGIFDDHCANLTRIANALEPTEVNSRFGYLNESTIEITAFGGINVYEMADELRRLNGESTYLLEAFQAAKGGGK